MQAVSEQLREFERERIETKVRRSGWQDLQPLSLFPYRPGIMKGMKYVNEYGYHASVPMDTLHTIPNGLMALLKQALFHYARK